MLKSPAIVFLFTVLVMTAPTTARMLQMDTTCCATCLQQDGIRGADALDFDTCSAGGGGCCFESHCRQSTMGDYTFDSSIAFQDGTATIEKGKWVQMTWTAVDRVTYVIINDGQEKNTQPKNQSTEAIQEGTWFQMCAQNSGQVYFRGWADGGCTASKEYSINVEDKGNDFSCSSLPASPSIGEGECNTNRASIIDGECVCASDWAGPPNCNNMPGWKWLVSIGGGIAAFFSIAVSIHAFVQRRKKQGETKESLVDVLRIPEASPENVYSTEYTKPRESPREFTL